ncbi:MAG: AbrB/MazE/SpoVT family DNA-binding domain-containing protein [Alphaproteobacteria bacterium]|nr:AbrB/MazE/SpoVT family DNA-binding domain-containing protein [Alphaproteobacteria bacterium]
MARTRAFKSGNSQAVRIPADIAYADTETELEITRNGDVIMMYPARGSLKEAVELLQEMPRLKHIPVKRISVRRTRWG